MSAWSVKCFQEEHSSCSGGRYPEHLGNHGRCDCLCHTPQSSLANEMHLAAERALLRGDHAAMYRLSESRRDFLRGRLNADRARAVLIRDGNPEPRGSES